MSADGSLWNMPGDVWAVCKGSGPVPVRGFIVLRGGGWCVYDDRELYPDLKSAVTSVGYSVGKLKSYVVGKEGQSRTVVTYENVLEKLKDEGWSVITQSEPFGCDSRLESIPSLTARLPITS